MKNKQRLKKDSIRCIVNRSDSRCGLSNGIGITMSTTLFNLAGQTALVTGASRGIGKALALGLAQAGANIVLVSRNQKDLDSIAQDVTSAGRRSFSFEADVSSHASIEKLFKSMDNAGITADILVNNAGIEQVCPSTDIDEALWDKIVDTNLKGAFFVAQNTARRLIDKNKTGSIINLGSLTSAVGVPTATPYTSSKTGVLGMTRALSSEWSPSGIRVNAIGPGYFRTDLTEVFYENTDWQAQMIEKIPMKRFGQLDDLVGITVLLAGGASSYITGQIFYIDGGYLASI